MEKQKVIELLRTAKKAHIQWIVRAQALTNGLSIEKDAIPMDCTECVFGKWLYSDGQDITAMPGMDIMKEIERTHFDLHTEYLEIFTLYFPTRELSFFAKLFSRKYKISEQDQEKAKLHFKNLRMISNELTNKIDRLESRLMAIGESSYKSTQE